MERSIDTDTIAHKLYLVDLSRELVIRERKNDRRLTLFTRGLALYKKCSNAMIDRGEKVKVDRKRDTYVLYQMRTWGDIGHTTVKM